MGVARHARRLVHQLDVRVAGEVVKRGFEAGAGVAELCGQGRDGRKDGVVDGERVLDGAAYVSLRLYSAVSEFVCRYSSKARIVRAILASPIFFLLCCALRGEADCTSWPTTYAKACVQMRRESTRRTSSWCSCTTLFMMANTAQKLRQLVIVLFLVILCLLTPPSVVDAADLSLGDYEDGMPGLHHLRRVPHKKCPSNCQWNPDMNHIATSASGMEKYVYQLCKATNDQKMSLSSVRRRRATALLMKDMFLSCNEGDIVETGVFTGGTSAVIMRMLMDFDRCNRTFYAYDSFDGLPDRDPQDMIGNSGKGKRGYFSVTKEAFIANMKAVNAWNDSIIRVEKGWFKDTVPHCPTEKIAFLRLDGDMYASTRDVIVPMYDRVVCNGIIYVDDYMGFNGAREAINDFRTQRRIWEPLNHVYEDNGRTDAAWWKVSGEGRHVWRGERLVTCARRLGSQSCSLRISCSFVSVQKSCPGNGYN